MAVLVLPKPLWERVVAHCLDGLPMEACGLLAGVELASGALVGLASLSEPAPAAAGRRGDERSSQTLPVEVAGEVVRGEVPGARAAGKEVAGEVGKEGVAGGAGAHGAGRPGQDLTVAEVFEVYPAANAALSARLYTVEPRDLLRADRAAERAGWSLVGVWHSHTHSPAYPSPTDIAAAPDPHWHYVVVSLSDSEPVLRSYRIVGEQVTEEPVLTRGLASAALCW